MLVTEQYYVVAKINQNSTVKHRGEADNGPFVQRVILHRSALSIKLVVSSC